MLLRPFVTRRRGPSSKAVLRLSWPAKEASQNYLNVKIPGLPPGIYAVAVIHDENADNKLAAGLFGIPAEGYGFSRDESGLFGPPKFDDARFRLDDDQNLQLEVKIDR